jgi:RNA polymerase sigma factor (sigma-70 family)
VGREPLEKASDADVIQRSQSDPAVFSAIFDRHFDAVYAYLARRIATAEAEDLAASTFTVAFERRDRFRAEATTARPWLLGIASNLLRNERRAEKRALTAVGRLAAPESAPPPQDGIEVPRVGAALSRLDRDQRDVLLLYAWEELSYEEIAAALEIPVGTVRSRLARARGRLRSVLGEQPGLASDTPEVSR